jgi:hypothetical protein
MLIAVPAGAAAAGGSSGPRCTSRVVGAAVAIGILGSLDCGVAVVVQQVAEQVEGAVGVDVVLLCAPASGSSRCRRC